MTPGTELEQWLNAKYGIESQCYKDLARRIGDGVMQGWLADSEVDGPRYRRSQVLAPCPETFFFSITAVLLDSTDSRQNNPEGSLRAAGHRHPTQFGKPSNRISATKRWST